MPSNQETLTLVTKIYQLAKRKNKDELNTLIATGVGVDTSYKGDNAIFLLAKEGDEDAVEFLINEFNASKNDAVEGAAQGGHIEFLNKLINNGAEVYYAIAGAAYSGDKDLLQKLFQHPKSIKRDGRLRKYFLELALENAAENGHADLMNELLVLDPSNLVLAICSAARGGQSKLFNALMLRHKIDPKLVVIETVKGGHFELLNDLVRYGADINFVVGTLIGNGFLEVDDFIRHTSCLDNAKLRCLLINAQYVGNDLEKDKIISRTMRLNHLMNKYAISFDQAQALLKKGTLGWLYQGKKAVIAADSKFQLPKELWSHVTTYVTGLPSDETENLTDAINKKREDFHKDWLEVKAFTKAYTANYKSALFSNPFNMQRKLKSGKIKTMAAIEDYAKEHPNSRTANVLSNLRFNHQS